MTLTAKSAARRSVNGSSLNETVDLLRHRVFVFVSHLRSHYYDALYDALVAVVREVHALLAILTSLADFDASELRGATISLTISARQLIARSARRPTKMAKGFGPTSSPSPLVAADEDSDVRTIGIAAKNLMQAVTRTTALYRHIRALVLEADSYAPLADASSPPSSPLGTKPKPAALAHASPGEAPDGPSRRRRSTEAAEAIPLGLFKRPQPSGVGADGAQLEHDALDLGARVFVNELLGRTSDETGVAACAAPSPSATSLAGASPHTSGASNLDGLVIDPTELQRQDTISEIVLTEEAYTADLNVLVGDFLMPLRFLRRGVLSDQARDIIFCNAEALLRFHSSLIEALRRYRSSASLTTLTLVDLVRDRMDELCMLYHTYGINTSMALHELAQVKNAPEGRNLRDFLSHNYRRLHWQGSQGLETLLVLPMKRLVKLTLLLADLLQLTPADHIAAGPLQQVVEQMRELSFRVHDERTKMANYHALLRLQAVVKNFASELPSNIDRVLVKMGLLELAHAATKGAHVTHMIVLCSDLVAWALPASREGEFRLVGWAPLTAALAYQRLDGQAGGAAVPGIFLDFVDGRDTLHLVAASSREASEWMLSLADSLAACQRQSLASEAQAAAGADFADV